MTRQRMGRSGDRHGGRGGRHVQRSHPGVKLLRLARDRRGPDSTGDGESARVTPRWTAEEAAFLQELGIPPSRLEAVGHLLLERVAVSAPAAPAGSLERLQERVAARMAMGAESKDGLAKQGAGSRRSFRGRPVAQGALASSRPWLVAAAVLAAAGLLVWTNPAVVQAALEHIARWLPGAGFVREEGAKVRALREPVSVPVAWLGPGPDRLTVESVVALPELTEVRIRMGGDGASGTRGGTNREGEGERDGSDELMHGWALQLPDGTVLTPKVVSWGPDDPLYLWFPPLPTGIAEVTLAHEPDLRLPLVLVDGARAGRAAMDPDAWSSARAGLQLGVPHLVGGRDEVVLHLEVRPAAGSGASRPDGAGAVPDASQGPGEAGDSGQTASWHLVGVEDLRLAGPLGTRLELADVQVPHGWVDAPTFQLVARFRGVLPSWVRSLHLSASRIRVLEPGAGVMRIPLDELAPGSTRRVDRRVRVGRWTVAVKEVARPDGARIVLNLDLGPAQDGRVLERVSVTASVIPEGVAEVSPGAEAGWIPDGVATEHDPHTGQLDRVHLTYPVLLPRDGVLVVRFATPQSVVDGPWSVEIPLR